MSATQKDTRASVDIDDDVELITEQIKALKELGKKDDEEPIGEGQRYDFSIRWGTVLAGRLRRLAHYSSLGMLDAPMNADSARCATRCAGYRTSSIDSGSLTRPAPMVHPQQPTGSVRAKTPVTEKILLGQGDSGPRRGAFPGCGVEPATFARRAGRRRLHSRKARQGGHR